MSLSPCPSAILHIVPAQSLISLKLRRARAILAVSLKPRSKNLLSQPTFTKIQELDRAQTCLGAVRLCFGPCKTRLFCVNETRFTNIYLQVWRPSPAQASE